MLSAAAAAQVRVGSANVELYSDPFLQNGYFPDLEAHKLMMTDVMEMYPQPDKNGMPDMSGVQNRKRKEPMEDRELPEDVKQMRLMPPEEQKKYLRQNHSEIEKRRRDKMNTYINELSSMIPTCQAMSRKVDKLTVLRLAVQHLKTIRGSLDSYTEGNYKPPMLTDKELKQLIIPCADGFMFVVDSARGRILYVSESVSDTLAFCPQDLIGQSLFDILHPKDISKVKEQLSNCDSTPRERLIDSKTLLPVRGAGEVPQSITRLHPGARRVFFCRMKCKQEIQVKQEHEQEQNNGSRRKGKGSHDKKYLSIQCTGYLKSWPLTKVGIEQSEPEPGDIGGSLGETETCMSCLVAVGRLQPSFQTTIEDCIERGRTTANGVEFTSRHGSDGKFSYVDQRVTLLLGYLPQELLGTSLYEHIQYDDIPAISDCHRNCLKAPAEVKTEPFRFRAKDGKFVRLESKWKQFRNPWTKEIEYIICKNSMVISKEKPAEEGGSFVDSNDLDFFTGGSGSGTTSGNGTRSNSGSPGLGKDIQRVISSHAEAAKIGRKIADEVIEKWRDSGSSASNSPLSMHVGSPGLNAATTAVTDQSTSSIGADQASANSKAMRDAMAEVEQDRNQLSGVIVSRSAKSMSSTSKSYTERPRSVPSSSSAIVSRASGGGGQAQAPTSLSDQIMAGARNRSRNSPPSSSASSEGNDEAAMAVIMSLLEADAGLGGPVDFNGMVWPLP